MHAGNDPDQHSPLVKWAALVQRRAAEEPWERPIRQSSGLLSMALSWACRVGLTRRPRDLDIPVEPQFGEMTTCFSQLVQTR